MSGDFGRGNIHSKNEAIDHWFKHTSLSKNTLDDKQFELFQYVRNRARAYKIADEQLKDFFMALHEYEQRLTL